MDVVFFLFSSGGSIHLFHDSFNGKQEHENNINGNILIEKKRKCERKFPSRNNCLYCTINIFSNPMQ